VIDLATKLEQLEALSENVRVGELEYKDGGEHYCPNILFTPHPMIPNKQRDIAVNFSPAAYGENEAIAKLIVAAVNFVRTELKELVGRAVHKEAKNWLVVVEAVCRIPRLRQRALRESKERIAELEAAIGKPAGKPEKGANSR
jgi:hypothetical protein